MYLRKKCKKMSCLICVFCLIIASANITAYADTSEGLSERSVMKEVEKIADEASEANPNIESDMVDDAALHVLSAMDAVTNVEQDEDDCITMEVELGEIDGEVTIVEANVEGTVLEVNENEKKNTVSVDNSGNIFINGSLAGNTYDESEEISLDAKGKCFNTTSCPYGKSSDYTKTVTSGKKMGYLNLTSGAVNLGAIAVGLVLAVWNPPLFVTIAGTIITGVIAYWASEKLNPKYISVKKWEYYHKKGQYVSGRYITKREIKLYPSKNYTGKSKYTKVSYRVIET